MKKSVSSTYLLGLSIADLLVLYVCLMRDWIRYMTVDVRNVADWTCKIQYWLHYALLDLSVWLLTALTLDRFISTLKPFTEKFICTKRHAKVIIMCVLVVDLIIHSHFLFGMELKQTRDKNEHVGSTCGPNSVGYAHFFKYYWHHIDLALYSIIPFIILSVSNVYIIYRIISNKRNLNGRRASTKSSMKRTSAMSRLLVALSIIFIVSTAPICIYLICKPYFIPEDVPSSIQEEDPWYAFVKILMYMNNTVNFILYCISGSKFRTELKRLFKGMAQRYQSLSLSSSTRSTRNSPASIERTAV